MFLILSSNEKHETLSENTNDNSLHTFAKIAIRIISLAAIIEINKGYKKLIELSDFLQNVFFLLKKNMNFIRTEIYRKIIKYLFMVFFCITFHIVYNKNKNINPVSYFIVYS